MKTLLMSLIIMTMNFQMPKLPYAENALEPVISKQTIEFHYGKHLQNYVNTLNTLVEGTEFAGKYLEYVVVNCPEGPMYNNAGQVLNHTLYFLQFNPKPKHNEPQGKLAEAINRDFGSFEKFKEEFNTASTSLFGSGWAWLSVDKAGKLQITKETNGGNPIRKGLKPLLGFDVWEHSYYLDYQNRRADHIKALWSIIDWDVVGGRL
ncbi:superoxide dismutase [Bacteroides coprosuis]|uniref:superoxide dismutase n=1 Tax=Bacteroides coprosuis TaxID=151276 RepID=UPI001D2DBD18|nr:superoxide dismutase [Bacteroides coprosuis]HJD91148.1 superoxide dismutase [Bacteroides coprosuis]